LVYKSGFIPRILGVLLIIGGIGYMTDSFASLLFPAFDSLISPYIAVSSIGEIAITFWLLIFGARAPKLQ
jgi:hypothetical protein